MTIPSLGLVFALLFLNSDNNIVMQQSAFAHFFKEL
jgi:hypothetical protein